MSAPESVEVAPAADAANASSEAEAAAAAAASTNSDSVSAPAAEASAEQGDADAAGSASATSSDAAANAAAAADAVCESASETQAVAADEEAKGDSATDAGASSSVAVEGASGSDEKCSDAVNDTAAEAGSASGGAPTQQDETASSAAANADATASSNAESAAESSTAAPAGMSGEQEQSGQDDAAAPEAALEDSYMLAEDEIADAVPVQATAAVIDAEDTVDDIVPIISYEDNKCQFSKDGRYILPKREQFPSIFCALRVTVRLEALSGSAGRNPSQLSPADLELLLCEELGLGGSVAHCEDARSADSNAPEAREIMAALSAALPAGREVGSTQDVERFGVTVTIVSAVETCDDLDPDRINSLAHLFREAGDGGDAIAVELPQLWIVQDPDFKAKSASIGLYPRSYWMGFLRCWGAVKDAEIFFRTVQHKSHEQKLHLVVQFKDRESLKMCFAFLHDRYLAHPKLEQGVRPPWCQLINFQDFKRKACAASKSLAARTPVSAKPGAKAAGKQRTLAKAAPGSVAAAAAAAANRASISPKATSAVSPKRAIAKRPVAKASLEPSQPTSSGANGNDRPLSPAEVMDGLSGRQLEVFQMVMSRMERLEKENQELMQILLQMQGLLQQQQRKNAQMTGVAGQPVGLAALGQLPGMSAGMSSSAELGGGGVRTWRPLGEGMSGEKRKIDSSEIHLQPRSGEAAPWKAQRRRQKRIKTTVASYTLGATGAGISSASSAKVAMPQAFPPAPPQGIASLVPPPGPLTPPPPITTGMGAPPNGGAAGPSPALAAYNNALLGV